MRNYNWEGKEQRAAAAVAHTQYVSQKYEKQIETCINKSVIYGPKFELPLLEPSDPHGAIVDIDSVGEAFMFEEGKTAILNFASHKNPGGMFIAGSRAQEECLCHESCLYNILVKFPQYYAWNQQNLNKGLYVNRAIYTPNVPFEHDMKYSNFDVITCAAPNKKAAQKYQNVSNEENTLALNSRIRFVLDIARDQGVETLILGAYGCGVFGQDAAEVALIMKGLLPYYDFKKVIFTIPKGNGNFEKFVKVWKLEVE